MLKAKTAKGITGTSEDYEITFFGYIKLVLPDLNL